MLEDKRFKLGGVDTSPSYVLFQTLLPLFWTLTCMIWMELARTDAVQQTFHSVIYVQKQKFSEWPETPRNVFVEIIKNTGKRSRPGAPHPSHKGGGRAPYLVGPLELLRPQLQLYIFAFGEKKNQREGFIAFYDTEPPQALKPLGMDDQEFVRGSGEGNPSLSSSSTILHHQFHDAHHRAWVIPS